MGGTIAWAQVPARSHSNQHCDKHGRMERLAPNQITVEKNGVEWEIDGSAPMEDSNEVELWYCPECVDSELRTYDRDADDIALLEEEIAEEWKNNLRRGQMDTGLFSVVSIDEDAASLLYCPYCSDRLEERGDGTVECSVHGSLLVDVATVEEVSPQ